MSTISLLKPLTIIQYDVNIIAIVIVWSKYWIYPIKIN